VKQFSGRNSTFPQHRYGCVGEASSTTVKLHAGILLAKTSMTAVGLVMLSGDVSSNPGPGVTTGADKRYLIDCLYFNARSLVHKTDKLQTLAVDVDLIAVTETWLRPDIIDCKILPTNDFSIYRRDRVS
jgi:hypothetical protein